ncbi:draxin isoform X2 [Mixophyes fleayi]|uniref:draxin isoform X2 n=1 Tax=Mixophyes fleayi TaxID=3061075 RepID=UPI003F4DFBCC
MRPLFSSLTQICLVSFVIMNHVMCVSAFEPRAKRKRISENKYNEDPWAHEHQDQPPRRSGVDVKDGVHGGMLSFMAGEEVMGSPIQVETGNLGQPTVRKPEEFQSFDFPYKERENHPPGVNTKRKKHNREQRKFNQRKHHRGRGFEAEPSGLFKEDLSLREPTHLAHVEMSSSVSATGSPPAATKSMSINERPTAVVEPQRRVKPHGKKGGDVMPTLDMTLFDWTDYEDMKPDTWPSAKKGKQREKINATSLAEEPCDHHLDCLPGSCCDLREHLCKPHNRGLNNKCFDDCMCTEGLRCYAKFHRHQRVTRRKGRCVNPESINKDQGSFISV